MCCCTGSAGPHSASRSAPGPHFRDRAANLSLPADHPACTQTHTNGSNALLQAPGTCYHGFCKISEGPLWHRYRSFCVPEQSLERTNTHLYYYTPQKQTPGIGGGINRSRNWQQGAEDLKQYGPCGSAAMLQLAPGQSS